MPKLLLRDEQQTTAKELPPKPQAAHIDTSATLQYYRYWHSEFESALYKLGEKEDLPEYIVGEWVPTAGKTFPLVLGRGWLYHSPALSIIKTASELPDVESKEDLPEYIVGEWVPTAGKTFPLVLGRGWFYHSPALSIIETASELPEVESYEVKYAQPTKATIATVLSQTAEYLGYALPKQLKLSIEPPAFKLLENLTLATLTQKVLDAIAVEKRRGTPIRSVSVTSFKDPEATSFEQLVVKVCLDCDSDTALRIWDDLSRDIEDLKRDLSPHEIKMLDERLGLDCEW